MMREPKFINDSSDTFCHRIIPAFTIAQATNHSASIRFIFQAVAFIPHPIASFAMRGGISLAPPLNAPLLSVRDVVQ